MTCLGCISAGSSKTLRTACSVTLPGCWCPKIDGVAENRDVGREAVDVRRDDARSRVQAMAADQARDGHLAMRLCEVGDQDEDADVDAAGLDVGAPARIDRDPAVVQDPLREGRLCPVEALDERLQADGPIEVLQGDCAVGERRAALE